MSLIAVFIFVVVVMMMGLLQGKNIIDTSHSQVVSDSCKLPELECGKRRGVMCSMVFSPVCGCDGVTYSNACEATNNGCLLSYTPGSC